MNRPCQAQGRLGTKSRTAVSGWLVLQKWGPARGSSPVGVWDQLSVVRLLSLSNGDPGQAADLH